MAALEQAEGRPDLVHSILERLPDPVILADDDARYTFLNAAARQLLGVPKGAPLSLADVAADSEGGQDAWRTFIQNGGERGGFLLRGADGEVLPIEYSAVTNFIPGCHLSILRDVSDRRRVDDLVRFNEERFTKAFISSPAPTNIRALETGAFVEVNEAFTKALGYWRADVIGSTAHRLGLWPDEAQLDGILTSLRLGQESEVRLRTQLRAKDRSLRDFSIAMKRVEMHGEPHLITYYWDLT